jgi:hypothetical protein
MVNHKDPIYKQEAETLFMMCSTIPERATPHQVRISIIKLS